MQIPWAFLIFIAGLVLAFLIFIAGLVLVFSTSYNTLGVILIIVGGVLMLIGFLMLVGAAVSKVNRDISRHRF